MSSAGNTFFTTLSLFLYKIRRFLSCERHISHEFQIRIYHYFAVRASGRISWALCTRGTASIAPSVVSIPDSLRWLSSRSSPRKMIVLRQLNYLLMQLLQILLLSPQISWEDSLASLRGKLPLKTRKNHCLVCFLFVIKWTLLSHNYRATITFIIE